MFNEAWGSIMVKMQGARKATGSVNVSASIRNSANWTDSQNAGKYMKKKELVEIQLDVRSRKKIW